MKTKKVSNQDSKNASASKKEFKSSLFTFNPSKTERSKIRRKRDSLIRKIMDFHNDKDIENRNKILKEFNSFYKKNYLVNDYSLESISYKNRDSAGNEELIEFMKIVKRWKIS